MRKDLLTKSPRKSSMGMRIGTLAATLLTATELVSAYDLDLTSAGERAHFCQMGVCPANIANRLDQSGRCRYGR